MFLRRVSETNHNQSLAAVHFGDSLCSGRLKIGVGENICVDESVDEKPPPKRQGSRRRGEVPSKSNSKATDEKPKRRGIKDSKSKSEAADEKPKRRGRPVGSRNCGD